MSRLALLVFAALCELLSAYAVADTCVSPAGGALIRSVHVTGSTLAPSSLSQAYKSLLGQPDTAAVRQGIAEAISAAYSHSDLALYDVSLASGENCGIVEISVLEGHVGSALVRGALDARASRFVKRYVDRITSEHPLRVSTLQRYVSSIREIAGLHATVQFTPTDKRDVVQMVIDVTQHRLKADASIDNRGGAVTGPIQTQLSTSIFGVLRGGDQLNLALLLTNRPRRLLGASGSYSASLDDKGTRLTLTASRSRYALPEYYYAGDTSVIGMNIDRPIIKTYSRNAYVGISIRRSLDHTRLFGYELLDNSSWSIGPSVSYDKTAGNSAFGASVTSAVGSVRRSSDLIYVMPVRKIRRVTAQAVSLSQLTRNATLRIKGLAQIGSRNLPSTEQTVLGGSEFGRAFANGFATGDSGCSMSVELTTRIGSSNPSTNTNEAYVFIDGGRLVHHDPISSSVESETLASAGIGIRVRSMKRTVFVIEAAAGTAQTFETGRAYKRLSIGLRRFIF